MNTTREIIVEHGRNLYPTKTTSSSSGFLVTFILVTITIWIAKYHWKRRHMYRHAANIPGPPGYPLIGSGLKFIHHSTDKLFTTINEMIDEYPELSKLWFGNSLIYLVSKPEHLEIVLNSPSCLEKSSLYHFVREVVGTGLLTAHVPKWKKHRRLIGTVFNQKLLNGFVPAFNEKSTTFMSILDEKKSVIHDMDILKLLSTLNLDILTATILSVELNEELYKTSKLCQWIDTAMMVIFMRTASFYYHVDFIFNLSTLSKTLNEAITSLRNFTKRIISEKRKISDNQIQKLKSGEAMEVKENTRKTLLDVLLLLSDKGVKLTDREIQEEVEIFLVTGTDTTAVTVAFALTMLGMHPDIQQKVLEEVLDVVGPVGDVAVEDLPKLKLMERVIKETLRLYPVGPYISRKTEADVNLGDAIIPADCQVVLGILKVQRNEKYWKDPLKFDPDRFLSEEIVKRHPYTYLPFSAGPRNCIAYRYAIMSMKVMLSKTIRKFVIGTSYKTVDEIKLFSNLVIRPKNGYKIHLELRK